MQNVLALMPAFEWLRAMGPSGGHWAASLASILVIVDPVGNIPVFLAVTEGDSDASRRLVAAKATTVAFGILAVFTFAGDFILRTLGITVAAFRVTGGIILFIVALRMLQAKRVRIKTSPEEEEEGRLREDVAIVPLAVPMLAGPGAITTVLVLTSGAAPFMRQIEVVVSTFWVMTLTFFIFRYASNINRFLGHTGVTLFTRLMGLLLAVMAVQYAATGLIEFFPGLKGG